MLCRISAGKGNPVGNEVNYILILSAFGRIEREGFDNMKRLLALILAISCMFTACSCGDNKGKDVSDASSNSNDQSDESNVKDVEYKTFDDLTRTQRIAYYDIYVDVPGYVETCSGRGFTSRDSWDYAIIVASSRDEQPGISVENDFADVMNDSYHAAVMSFNDYQCEDYTPDTIDTVTLPCGAEAIKFEGIQPMEFWGTTKECYLYGYAFVFNDILVIVSYMVFDDSAVDDAKKTELTNYVDEMVQTVRTEA